MFTPLDKLILEALGKIEDKQDGYDVLRDLVTSVVKELNYGVGCKNCNDKEIKLAKEYGIPLK